MNLSAQLPTLWRMFAVPATEVTLIDGVDPVKTDPGDFVKVFLNVGLSLGVVVAIVLVATAGYKMMSSRGEPKAIADAQEQIGNAIMGLMLILAAVVVVKLITEAVGIKGIISFN